MNENKKSYFAVIPASVRYDEKLPMGARMLYGEITALINERGYCWATNGYFAELYKTSLRTISDWLAKLERCGYIQRKIIFKEGTGEVAERRIYITPVENNLDTPRKNLQEGIEEKFNTPHEENFRENITVFNNTLNNICVQKTKNDYSEDFQKFWEAYPKGRRVEKKRAYRCWKTRLREGYKPDDMITAAKNYAAWCERNKTEPRFIKHPSTFLGPDTPLEEYLKAPEEQPVDATTATLAYYAKM